MTQEKKILVTGAFGQIGSELVPALQQKYGKDNVIAADIRTPEYFDGLVENLDVLNLDALKQIIEKYQINVIYHLVSLLSAKGEENPDLTWRLNLLNLKDILDLSKDKGIQVFWPSSIAAFGPTSPRENTPQETVLEPTIMYGVTKVAGELLCRYYWLKYGLDVRTLRYPGLISWKQEPGGGTTDYAVAIFYDGIKTGKYQCFVREDTTLPMMYMDDAIRGTLELMEKPKENFSSYKPYNFSAISFTAKELAEEVNKKISVEVSYIPDFHQAIADSWPKSINDSEARKDWGWHHEIDLSKMTEIMLENLRNKLLK